LGTVIDRNGDRLVLDDGTGQITVTLEGAAEVNQMVRVFGRVIPLESGFELQGEVAQDMSRLDLGLLKRVKGLRI